MVEGIRAAIAFAAEVLRADEEQRELRQAALDRAGSRVSGDPLRAENAGNMVRQRLRRVAALHGGR